VSHLAPLSEEEANRLLGMVVDVENIFMSMHREEDGDTKRVYYYLFKVCPIDYCYQWPCNIEANQFTVLLININICIFYTIAVPFRNSPVQLCIVTLMVVTLTPWVSNLWAACIPPGCIMWSAATFVNYVCAIKIM
jgi:hypothetical protein